MVRLPEVSGDRNEWGDLLNEYLTALALRVEELEAGGGGGEAPVYVWVTNGSWVNDTEEPIDSPLSIALEANITYQIDAHIITNSDTPTENGDVNMRICWLWTSDGWLNQIKRFCYNATDFTDMSRFSGSENEQVIYSVANNPTSTIHEHLIVRPASEPGTLTLRYAQGTANAANLHIFPGSYLRVEKCTPGLEIMEIS